MAERTAFLLSVLLELRATFEAARRGGDLKPDAPGPSQEEARLARDRTRTAATKIGTGKSLTQAEVEEVRATFSWYRELPEADDLPLDVTEQLFDVWHSPPDALGPSEVFDRMGPVFNRWATKEALERPPDHLLRLSQSNGNPRRKRELAGDNVSFETEEAYERARHGFTQLATAINDDVDRALEKLDEIEDNLETVRKAMRARLE